MAYPHDKVEVIMTATSGANILLASSTGEKARWTCGFVPHILRAVAVVHRATQTTHATNPVISIRHATTAGATSATGQQITTLTFPSGKAQGAVAYRSGLNTKVLPGQEIIAHVTTAAGAATRTRMILYLEPSWEVPGNVPVMVTSD
jgi:hypothetical protein